MRNFVSWMAFVALVFATSCCAQSCDELKPSLVLVTQERCPPCKPAKELLKVYEATGKLDSFLVKQLSWETDRDKIKATGAVITRTPALVLLDKNGEFVTSVQEITKGTLEMISSMVPVDCVQPIKVVLDRPAQALEAIGGPQPGDIIITWDLATQYRQGYYNGTFAFYDIDYALNSLGRHWKVYFKRVTSGGQYHVIQGNYQLKNNPNAAEWTNGNTTIVSPTFRFASPVQCNMCTVHERLHTAGLNMGNGGHHAQDGGIMGANGGYLLNPNDWPYMGRYPWRSAKRPNQEPDWFKAYLGHNAVLGTDDASSFPLLDVQAK